jgi:predicted transcriptional regulator
MSNTELDPKTIVHHAIIDLYELYDYEDVDYSTIFEYTDLSQRQIVTALQDLEADGTIKQNSEGVIIEAENKGYFPTTL